jgi:hypothetical protein
LSALTCLLLAGAAAAAGGGTVSIGLHPDKVNRHSKLTISASGFSETSLPRSAVVLVQRGFKVSARSVSRLCTNPSACPAASTIGTGTAQVTGTLLGLAVPDTVNLTLYLGKPTRAGDIASVIVAGRDTEFGLTATGRGRLFKDSTRRLELLFDQFPSVQGLPSGTSITLNSLTLTAGATRTVMRHHKRVTFSLITNPSRCTGHWSGRATVTFPNQAPVSQSLRTPCVS